jgi:hypothetical protein
VLRCWSAAVCNLGEHVGQSADMPGTSA